MNEYGKFKVRKSSRAPSGFHYISALLMRILSQHSWEFVCIVSLIVIQTLLLGYSIQFNFANIINGGDTLQLLNPQLFMQRSFSVWQETGTGISEPIPGYWIFYATPLYILNQILGNITVSTFIFFVALSSLPSVSMFLLSNKITGNNGLSFFISVFYSLNLYTAIEFHTPINHILYLFGVTPLLVLTFTKIESSVNYRKKLFYLVIYLLLYLPLVRTVNKFMIYLVLIPLIGFIINFRVKIPVKRFLKYVSLISLTVFLVALPFLVPLIFNMQTAITPVTEAYSKSAVEIALGQKLEDSIRFIRSYAWKCSYDESFAGVLSYSFLKYYGENLFLRFISYYPILIVFLLFLFHYPKLQGSDKYKVLGLLLLALLSLFATTPSLTSTGRLLYENDIYIFRSAWKYFSIPLILCLSLILAFLLRRLAFAFRPRKVLVLLMILFLIHSAYILPAICFYGKTVNQSWVVQIPKDYYDVASFLNRQDEEFRVLPLPLTTSWAGYTPYKWGYVGPDILYTLTNKPLIDKSQNTIAPEEYLALTEKLEAATPGEIIKDCQTLNVKYILLRNDVGLEHPYQKVYNSPEYYRDVLENSDAIKDKHVFGNLVLYELRSYTPRVFLVSANASGNSLSEKFLHSTYQPESINYLHFADNPITLKISKKEPIESFNLEITFALEPKNVTEGDWQANNHALMETDLFKVAISPKGGVLAEGVLYFFAYLKTSGFWDMAVPFGGKEISSINLDFKNGSLSVYLNKFKIGEANLKLVDRLSVLKIGSNIVNTERLVGKVYNLNFCVNGENIVSTQKLFSSYPDYVESETRYKLHLSSEKVELRKASPTKYIATLNNSSVEDNFFLVFLSTYNPHWKAYYVENGLAEAVPEENHIHAFDYANAWYLNKTGNFTIVLEYTPQRLYDAGLKTSFLMFGLLLSIIIVPESKMLKLKKFTSKVKELIIGFSRRLKVDR